MTQPSTSRARRTYFNNPLVEEALQHLGAAVEHPTTAEFRAYLEQHLHHNSQKTRFRAAEYIAQRFSREGVVNRDLARAVARFGNSRIGREILYFEYLRAMPVLHDIASLWLAELPPEGVTRPSLLAFLEPRLGGRSADKVAGAAVAVFRRCNKLTSPKLAVYVPVWSEPPLEAFCYALAALYPEPAMVNVNLFAGLPILRAMLWPQPAIEPLLKEAERWGHVSKISELDQYHQFTLAEPGTVRMDRLLADPSPVAVPMAGPPPTDPPQGKPRSRSRKTKAVRG